MAYENHRITYDEDGNMYVDGVKAEVVPMVYEDKKSMNIAYKNIKTQFDVGAMTAEEFYRELESLRDYYLADGSAAWWQYTKQIMKYEDGVYEKQEKERIKAEKEAEKQRQEMIDREISRQSSAYALGLTSAKEYYDSLEQIRNRYFDKESKEWESFTVSMGKFYKNQLETAKDEAESLTSRLTGGIMHHYTIKDKEGKVTDSFYSLKIPDERQIEGFFEGYNYLTENGAPRQILDDYLSMDAASAESYLEVFKTLGNRLPGYFERLTEVTENTMGAAERFFGTDVLSQALSEVISQLEDAGVLSGIEINQNFYGDNISPSQVAQQTVNALKLQGVGL